MIGNTYNTRKLDKLENNLNSFIDTIKIYERDLDYDYCLDPKKALSLITKDELRKMCILEISNHFKLDLSMVGITDQTYLLFIFQTIILFKYKYDSFTEGDKKLIDQLIIEYNEVIEQISEESIIEFNKNNMKFLTVYFKDYFNSDLFSLIKKVEVCYIKKIGGFRDLVNKGKYPYIKHVNYMLLKNKLVGYSIINNASSNLLDIVSKVINNSEKSIDLITDAYFIKKIKSTSYETIMKEQKESLAPKLFSEKFGINQNELLLLQKKQLRYLKELPLDYAILDLENIFEFNFINKYGISKLVYDLLYETHKYHTHFPFYTFIEWQDEQEREGKTPTKKGWKTYMLRRVELIVPNIFK